ncbi:MAG TPA: alpha/beta hydrolase-fold protein [Polyangiaceae bacterium]|nr:alpha/beta hydrolase-fold protein [Polyangiaceae bacterium]
MPLRLPCWALVILYLLGTRDAAADVLLAPSSEGYLGAWLVAGPLSASRAATLDAAAALPVQGAIDKATGAAFQLHYVSDGALDLRKAFAVDRKPGRLALVGGTLQLAHDLDGWLLAGADGGLSIYVDGAPVFQRSVPQLRGQAWDVIPLALTKGRHRIVFRLAQAADHWAFMARIVDRERFLAPRGASLLLEGTTARDAERLATSLQTHSFWTGLDTRGYRPGVAIEYRRGAPRDLPLAVRVRGVRVRTGETLFELNAGISRPLERGTSKFEVSLPPLPASLFEPQAPEAIRVELRTGATTTNRTLFLSGKAPASAARAEALLQRKHPSTSAREGVVMSTLEQRLARVKRLGAGLRASAGSVERAIGQLQSFMDSIEQGQDPLLKSGLLSLARRSELDGSLQRFALHVPRGVDPSAARRYPLIVVLHGYGGSPSGVLSAFFDAPAHAPSVQHPSFVLAPHAHGNAFYRGPSEHEVLRALAWVRDQYPIDPDRITLTGVSMGGTGTAELGLRHADQFAALSPLCGYHSYFVRRDIVGRPLRSWEREQMQHYSPASFAENGRQLPLFVAHGLKDFPLENSRVLIARYRELGQRVSADWPDVGHAVWKEYWKGARMWPVLAAQKRNPAPARVTFTTDSLRVPSQYWVRLRAFEPGARTAHIDVRVQSTSEVSVTTSGVAGLELTPPETLVSVSGPRRLTINGEALEYAGGEALFAERGAGRWTKGRRESNPAHKRARLEGPLRDVYNEPLVFVYGTLDPATWRANREVARTLARLRFGPEVHYPVIADRDLTAELEREHSLFLVGSARDHVLLEAANAALPIGATEHGVRVGKRRHQSAQIGALFIHPSPRAPDRYWVVLSAPTLPGLFRALSLPALLPDFVVYDVRVAPATSQQVLGAAGLLEAGYFNADWSVPEALQNSAQNSAAQILAAQNSPAPAPSAQLNARGGLASLPDASASAAARLPRRGAAAPTSLPARAPDEGRHAPDAGSRDSDAPARERRGSDAGLPRPSSTP